jgi:hypothetical protein
VMARSVHTRARGRLHRHGEFSRRGPPGHTRPGRSLWALR